MTRYAPWFALAALALTICGCALFQPGPDGTSEAQRIAEQAGDVAELFGPIGGLVSIALGAVASVATALAARSGRKASRVRQAATGVVEAIDRWKAQHPQEWQQLRELLRSYLDREDSRVIDELKQRR